MRFRRIHPLPVGLLITVMVILAPAQAQDTHSFDCAAVVGIPQAECEALVALYNATNGDEWANNDGWLITDTPCEWDGVACDGGNITGLDLSENRLAGALPPEIGQLASLQELFLGGNDLTTLPPEIGQLTRLYNLFLEDNQLTALPPEIGQLTNLQELELDVNQLMTLPPEIMPLTNLKPQFGLQLCGSPLTIDDPALLAFVREHDYFWATGCQ